MVHGHKSESSFLCEYFLSGIFLIGKKLSLQSYPPDPVFISPVTNKKLPVYLIRLFLL